MKKTIFSIVAMLLSIIVFSQNEARLLRFPAIYENQIVFTYAGDLYTVNANGGLTNKTLQLIRPYGKTPGLALFLFILTLVAAEMVTRTEQFQSYLV